MYNQNDYLVYRKDICLVKEIIKIKNENYYNLVPLCDKSLSLKVPVDNRANLIRKVMNKNEALELINILPSIKPLNLDDKNIDTEYQKLMNSNNIIDLIKIIKTAYLRNDNRIKNGLKITEKDENYFERAEKLFYMELSISLNLSYDETKEYIINKLSN